MRAAISHS